jgi:hypothetical protein
MSAAAGNAVVYAHVVLREADELLDTTPLILTPALGDLAGWCPSIGHHSIDEPTPIPSVPRR